MIYEGQKAVVAAITEKRDLEQAGKPHEHIRPLLIQGGGLMCGAYGVGAAIALEELGYRDAFSYLVGVSSGSPIMAHFAAGTSTSAADILADDCTSKAFLNMWRFWHQVDIEYLVQLAKNHPRHRVDAVEALAHKSELYFGAAIHETAEPRLLRPTDPDSFFDCLRASIHLQNISPQKVFVDGVRYVDGGFASPHVIEHAIDVLQPTHVLLITNNNLETKSLPLVERFCNQTIFRSRLSSALARVINNRIAIRDQALGKVRASPIPTGIVWGDGSLGRLERSPEHIRVTVECSRLWWHGLLTDTHDL